jgi:ribosomal protein L11 methyltransferase
MDYIELNCTLNPIAEGFTDLLAGELAAIGFESFVDTDQGLTAFVQVDLFDEKAVNEVAENYKDIFCLTYTFQKIEGQNWNEEWEKNFEPVIVGDQCLIKGTFHHGLAPAKYTITIDPKMSFGTGHHETTQLMIENILKTNFEGKKILDMGCGTGVLAILAAMRGASDITAIDIEEWAYNNSIENIALNNVSQIKVYQGDVALIKDQKFEIVLANINKNVLLADIPEYVKTMTDKGLLILSGIYIDDLPDILACAQNAGLTFIENNERKRWISAIFTK